MRPDKGLRDAATVVLVRFDGDGPRILMGQRPAKAAFLPSLWVFPGGAVEAGDAALGLRANPETNALLSVQTALPPAVLIAAALRELYEETGLVLGRRHAWQPSAALATIWHSMAADGVMPRGDALHHFARAITPPGRPRRFDARFFWADAKALCGDPDHLAPVEEELGDLAWLSLAEARCADLAFVTRVMVEEIASILAGETRPGLPFLAQGGQGGVVHFLQAEPSPAKAM